MILKVRGNVHSDLLQLFATISKWSKKWYFVCFLFFCFSSLLFFAGAFAHQKKYIHDLKQMVSNMRLSLDNMSSVGLKRIVANYLSGIQTNPERITIDISYKNFQKLAYKREMALKKGMLITSSEGYVPGRIRYKNETIKIKIRLKGDWTDHLQGDKWSFRIVIKDDNTLWGMKQFSIQTPETRNYVYEWIFHEMMKREGLLSLRYKFVNVTLNGKDMGIYAVEEHFDKRLIENSKLREGPIIRFSEDLFWDDVVYSGYNLATPHGYHRSRIDAFQTKKILENALLTKEYGKASALLDGFRIGHLKTSDVFDIDKLSKYFAISDLLGGGHGHGWNNERFYYNPITSRLEPIGFDADAGHRISFINGSCLGQLYELNLSDRQFLSTLFSDRRFLQNYVQQLQRISNPAYLKTFFRSINDELQEQLALIYREVPSYKFEKSILYQNQEIIRKALNPLQTIRAYFVSYTNGCLEMEIGNLQQLPVEVLSIAYKGTVTWKSMNETILQGNGIKPVVYERCKFSMPEKCSWSKDMIVDLTVNYKIVGMHTIKQTRVVTGPYFSGDIVKNDVIRQNANVEEFSFLVKDDHTKTIVIKSGKHKLTKNLICPRGYKFVAQGDTEINILNSAMILSYSPLDFAGTEDKAILIYSADSSGQGIFVLNAERESVFKYVHFDKLSNPAQNGWELTGSVTFYESPVIFSHCQFTSNRSEDALNLIRTTFIIENTMFDGIFADALDSDFSIGKIIKSSFTNCGNDAIDISGSEVEIEDLFINKVGDKGVSAGEDSRLIVNNAEVRNAQIAVAGKDKSELSIEKIRIRDSKIGFAVYKKKSEFGPAFLKATDVEMVNVGTPYLLEEGSQLIINNQEVELRQKNVMEIISGAYSNGR